MEYPLWRIWAAKGTPLNELKFNWTYEDVLKAHAILEMQDAWELGADGIQKEG